MKTCGKSGTSKAATAAPKGKTAKARAKPDIGGRPSKYVPAYAEQARKLALLGATNERMADFFGVALSTLHLWREAHPEFSDALKAGKEQADAKVAESLYRSALGGETIVETREEIDAEGNPFVRKVVKELPANVTAQFFWLKNRQPQLWRDKVVLEDETPPEKLAETAKSYETLMAAARERQRQVLIERGIVPPDSEA